MSANPNGVSGGQQSQITNNATSVNNNGQYLGPGDAGYNSNDAYNGVFQANPNFGQPGIPVPQPAPFVPAPNALTPQQNAAAYTPPPNTPILPATSTPTAGDPNALANLISAGKGQAKGPSTQQAITPMQGPYPDTAAMPMDFHQQLQQFINSGLLGGQSRLQ